jgi:ParB family chromosome partitioning protein
MQVIEVDPKNCVRWKFADRSGFEFGDIYTLSQDILKNGQIEPAILRKSTDPQYKYEVIAGSRRWRACLDSGIPLKGIVQELSDEQAAVAQIKENQQLSICDYSKGIYYAKLIKEKKMTTEKLAESIGCSRPKLQNFLDFEKVPQAIWDAVGNLSRVSSRTASTIYALSQKGKNYISALIDLAEEIRKGIGSRTLEQKVLEAINGKDNIIEFQEKILLPSGKVVAHWTKSGIQFAKDIHFNQKEFEKIVVRYFEKTLKKNLLADAK